MSAQTLVVKEDENTTICTIALGPQVEVDNDNITVIAPEGLGPCVPDGTSVSLDVISPSSIVDVEPGTEVTLEWTVPEGQNCSLTRNGSALLNNTQIQANALSRINQTVNSNTTFSMTCSSSKVEGSKTVGRNEGLSTAIVSVEQPDNPGPGSGELCTQQLSGFTRLLNVSGASSMEELYSGWMTAGAAGQIYIDMENQEYFSFAFTTPNTRDAVEAIKWDQNTADPEQVRVSISQCIGGPMQATAVADPDCYYQGSGSNGGITIVSNPSTTLRGNCELEPNTTYFYNAAFINEDGGPGCKRFGGCSWLTTTQ